VKIAVVKVKIVVNSPTKSYLLVNYFIVLVNMISFLQFAQTFISNHDAPRPLVYSVVSPPRILEPF